MVQINKRIKAHFGCPVDEIKGERNLFILRTIRENVDWIIREGESLGLSRRMVKDNVYAQIDRDFQHFKR